MAARGVCVSESQALGHQNAKKRAQRGAKCQAVSWELQRGLRGSKNIKKGRRMLQSMLEWATLAARGPLEPLLPTTDRKFAATERSRVSVN
jgi:hypothetical protein